jgi:pimeloyl-ACP methyl ester carboxylesterase
MAEWLAGFGTERRIWIGNSSGSRVGLQLAARHPKYCRAVSDRRRRIAAAALARGARSGSPPAAGLCASRAA